MPPPACLPALWVIDIRSSGDELPRLPVRHYAGFVIVVGHW
jgi:hypothetical protein